MLGDVVVLGFVLERWASCFDTDAPLGRDGLPCPSFLVIEGTGSVGGEQRPVRVGFGGPALWGLREGCARVPEVGRVEGHFSASLSEVTALRLELDASVSGGIGRRVNLRVSKQDGTTIAAVALGDRVAS